MDSRPSARDNNQRPAQALNVFDLPLAPLTSAPPQAHITTDQFLAQPERFTTGERRRAAAATTTTTTGLPPAAATGLGVDNVEVSDSRDVVARRSARLLRRQFGDAEIYRRRLGGYDDHDDDHDHDGDRSVFLLFSSRLKQRWARALLYGLCVSALVYAYLLLLHPHVVGDGSKNESSHVVAVAAGPISAAVFCIAAVVARCLT